MAQGTINIIVNQRLNQELKERFKINGSDVQRVEDENAPKKPNQLHHWKIFYKGTQIGRFIVWLENNAVQTEYKI